MVAKPNSEKRMLFGLDYSDLISLSEEELFSGRLGASYKRFRLILYSYGPTNSKNSTTTYSELELALLYKESDFDESAWAKGSCSRPGGTAKGEFSEEFL